MSLRFILALLLVTIGVSDNLAHAESAVEETDPSRLILNTPRYLQGSQTTTEEAEDVDTEDEERGGITSGFNKLKSIFQRSTGLTNKVGALQKDAGIVKGLQKNPQFMKILEPLKSHPEILKKIDSMKKNPQLVEALQKAPVTEANFNKVRTAVTEGRSGHYEPTMLGTLCLSLLIVGILGVAAIVSKLD